MAISCVEHVWLTDARERRYARRSCCRAGWSIEVLERPDTREPELAKPVAAVAMLQADIGVSRQLIARTPRPPWPPKIQFADVVFRSRLARCSRSLATIASALARWLRSQVVYLSISLFLLHQMHRNILYFGKPL
jgi:hypothetical protein